VRKAQKATLAGFVAIVLTAAYVADASPVSAAGNCDSLCRYRKIHQFCTTSNITCLIDGVDNGKAQCILLEFPICTFCQGLSLHCNPINGRDTAGNCQWDGMNYISCTYWLNCSGACACAPTDNYVEGMNTAFVCTASLQVQMTTCQ
jgi:hypothetical protein